MSPKTADPENIPDGRREVDVVWRGRMEREIKEVFARLTSIDVRLEVNTVATLKNGTKLDAHVERTESFIQRMAPAGTAVDYYTKGVQVIGAIGMTLQWFVKWTVRFLKVTAPIAAAVAAVYATWPAETKALLEWLKFWKH